jgi:hypothetical protein
MGILFGRHTAPEGGDDRIYCITKLILVPNIFKALYLLKWLQKIRKLYNSNQPTF